MYPKDTDKVVFLKHPTIWQALHTTRHMIYIEAESAEEAYEKIVAIFKAYGRDVLEECIQFRRLPVCALKEEQ